MGVGVSFDGEPAGNVLVIARTEIAVRSARTPVSRRAGLPPRVSQPEAGGISDGHLAT